MNKKLLSIILVMLMVMSSVSGLFTMTASAENVEAVNLMAETKVTDWTSSWTGYEDSGREVDGEIKIQCAWRSAYTKVTLLPNREYTLNFNFAQVRVNDVRVFPASEITDEETQLRTASSNGGDAPGGTTNLASGTYTTELPSGTPVDGKFYSASETFTTTAEEEYYIILDCKDFVTTSELVLRDMSITEVYSDPNKLNDSVMESLEWKALWGTITKNPKNAVLDKSASKSGNAYAMTFDSNSRWRDNYTTITLEANTAYEFSFYYKSGTNQEKIDSIGFVEASKVDFSSINGDRVSNHLKDDSTTILGKDNAVIGNVTDGNTWNKVTTTFITAEETEYVMYFSVTFPADPFTSLTLSDFNMAEIKTSNYELNNFSNWDIAHEIMSGPTYGATQDALFYLNTTWQSIYAKVTLEANTYYNLNFKFKGPSPIDKVHLSPVNNFYANLKNNSCPLDDPNVASDTTLDYVDTYFANDVTADNYTEYKTATADIKTGAETEYYLIIHHKGAIAGADGNTIEGYNYYKDFILEKDGNILGKQLSNSSNWKSTAGGKFTPATESVDGNPGFTASHTFWRDSYTLLSLKPNTNYHLSFNYKGDNQLHKVQIFQSSLITNGISSERVQTDVSDDSQAVFNGDVLNVTADSTTWNNISLDFTTNDETEYYVVFVINNGGDSTADYTVSDISLTGEYNIDDLTDTVPADWTSSWGGKPGETLKHNAITSAWRSAYIKVDLAANRTYDFSFKGANVKVSKIRVYAASQLPEDITTLHAKEGHMNAGDATNLVTSFISTAPEIDFAKADFKIVKSYYDYSATFRTTEDTSYYIVIDPTQFKTSQGGTDLYFKNLNLTAVVATTAYNSKAAISSAEASSTGKNGLRIYNSIEKAWVENADIVEFGSIAIRKAKLESLGTTFTCQTSGANKGVAYSNGKYSSYQAPKLWDTTDEAYIFTSYLTNLPTRYYGEDISVRTYAIDNEGNYYYGRVVNVSIFKVANAIDNSASPSEEDKAIFADFVGAAQAEYVDWCAANGKNNTVGKLYNTLYPAQ